MESTPEELLESEQNARLFQFVFKVSREINVPSDIFPIFSLSIDKIIFDVISIV